MNTHEPVSPTILPVARHLQLDPQLTLCALGMCAKAPATFNVRCMLFQADFHPGLDIVFQPAPCRDQLVDGLGIRHINSDVPCSLSVADGIVVTNDERIVHLAGRRAAVLWSHTLDPRHECRPGKMALVIIWQTSEANKRFPNLGNAYFEQLFTEMLALSTS